MTTDMRVRMLRLRVLLVLAALAVVVLPSSAEADIGVVSVRPTVGEPGDIVSLRIHCGGCPRGENKLPVSLVPAAHAPRPTQCRDNAFCRPAAREAPHQPPFRFLGLTAANSRLRFAVPDLRPGRYAFVIYCDPCYRGPAGSLIVDTNDPTELLRVRPNRYPGGGGERGTRTIWWVLAGAGVLFVVLAGAMRWRR